MADDMADSKTHVCGECGRTFERPRNIDFAYSVETFPNGEKVIKTEPRDVSPCCGEDFE